MSNFSVLVTHKQQVSVATFGGRIRLELKRLGMKQSDAIKMIEGVDFQAMRDAITGRKRVTANFLLALSKVGVDVQFVVTGKHQKDDIGYSSVHAAVQEAVHILSVDKKVDPVQLANAVVHLLQKENEENSNTDCGT
jgi:hypothetical protein